MKRIHQDQDNHRIACLSEGQLASTRGGDICLVGYKTIDENGDGQIDYLIPIYAPCSGAENQPAPTV